MSQSIDFNTISTTIKSTFTYFVLVILLAFGSTAFSQSPAPGCPNVTGTSTDGAVDVFANDTLFLNCGESSVKLDASFLKTGSTNTYKVSSIAYTPPFPFTGGTALFVGSDDIFSNLINLPFDFCFFGSTYNRIVVGANGLVTFDAARAGGTCCWSFNANIPNATAPACPVLGAGNGGYYRNSINGAVHDLDPSVAGSDINYSVLGTAPCRTFVVNFNNVGQFSCNANKTTQQIVIYETTNAIEVYIKNKPTCTGWNSGNATIGIQNAAGTVGYAPPGRNVGAWTASNEAWRFTPDGAPNYTITWRDKNGVALGTGPSQTVSIPAPYTPEKFSVEIEYTNCNGDKILESDDLVVAPKPFFTLSSVETETSCNGTCDGTSTISVTGGTAPFSANWPSGNTTLSETGLCSGSYPITITDFYGCTENITVVIDEPSALKTTTDFTDALCFGSTDGTASVNVTGGIAPYRYLWSSASTTNSTTGGAGTYVVDVLDANDCPIQATVLIGEPTQLVADTLLTNLSCIEAKDGKVVITASGGTSPYTYKVDATGFQSSGTFNNLAVGSHTMNVKDKNNCEISATFILKADSVSVFAPNDTTICEGQSVTFSATGYYTSVSWDNGITNGVSFTPVIIGSTTYTVTATNEGGCTITDEVILTLEPVLDPTIDPAGPFCGNADDYQLNAATPGGTWSGTGVSPTGLFSPSTAGQGTHTITYSFGGFCPTTHSINIGINNTFDAAIDPVSPVCELNNSFKLTSVTPGGKWFGTGIVDVTDSLKSDFDPKLAGPGNHWVFHSVSGTCGDLDSLEIVVIGAERAAIDPTPEFCPTGSGANLIATPSGGTFSGTGIVGTDFFDPSLTGSGSFKVYYTPSSSCRTIDSAIVVVVDTLKGTPDTVLVNCFADQASITTLVTGGKQPLSYNWPTSPTTTGATANNLPAGDHPVTVTDALGCSITLNHRVDEPSQLTLAAQADVSAASCGGYFDGAVVFHPTGGTSVSGKYNYSLSPNNGAFGGIDSYNNLPAGNYTATISDDNGCSITEQFTITEPLDIVVSGTPSDEYCGLMNGAITINTVTGGVSASGTYTYEWLDGPSTRDRNGLSASLYTLVVSDDNSCTDTTRYTVNNGSGFSLDLDTIPTTCFNGNDGKAFVKSIINGTPGATYTYNWDNGSATDTAFNLAIGTYSVTVTDDQNCPTSASVTVTQPSEVTIASIADSTLCDGQTFTTTLTANNGNGGPYTFFSGSGSVSGNTITANSAGTYTVVAYDVKNCNSQKTYFTLTYRDPLEVDITAIPSACPGDEVTLSANAAGGNGAYNYNWNNGAFSGQSIQYTTRTDGVDEIVTVILNDGCSLPDTAYFTITFNDIPKLEPIFTPNEGCEALTVDVYLENKVTHFQSLVWNMGDNQTVTNQNEFVHIYPNSGTYTVSIDAITAEGCMLQATWTDTIKVYPLPYGEINQNPSRITVINNNGLFTVKGSGNIADIQWDLSKEGVNIHSENSLRFDYDFTGDSATYKLDALLISDKGCLQSIDHIFKVYPEQKIYVPNAFTPNGDGVNDVFSISTFGVPLDEFEIIIFNRWGEPIFTSDQLNFEWDGTYRNEKVSNGVYAFKILYNDGIPNKVYLSGRVTLLR